MVYLNTNNRKMQQNKTKMVTMTLALMVNLMSSVIIVLKIRRKYESNSDAFSINFAMM